MTEEPRKYIRSKRATIMSWLTLLLRCEKRERRPALLQMLPTCEVLDLSSLPCFRSHASRFPLSKQGPSAGVEG